MYNLKGRVAIVTGAGSGIGWAIAMRLAGEGAAVVGADMNGAAAKKLIAEIRKSGRRGMSVEMDVSAEGEVKGLIRKTLGQFGQIDILVNNAGIADTGVLIEFEEQKWDQIMAVNLKGAFLCARAAAQEMIPRKQGRIVNIASIAGKRGVEFMGAYSASKFGVISLTQTLAKELGRHNITVNAICPGFIWTAMWQNLAKWFRANVPHLAGKSEKEIFEDRVKSMTPLLRPQTPEDIANLAAFLVSDQAGNITGQSINLDGGTVMH
ncbi:MAG: SDR family oxidoreductase [Syntrophaceae bacterium]|nr:SDR family oxidoreductase [Syntrophaceae bacterium]